MIRSKLFEMRDVGVSVFQGLGPSTQTSGAAVQNMLTLSGVRTGLE